MKVTITHTGLPVTAQPKEERFEVTDDEAKDLLWELIQEGRVVRCNDGIYRRAHGQAMTLKDMMRGRR